MRRRIMITMTDLDDIEDSRTMTVTTNDDDELAAMLRQEFERMLKRLLKKEKG